MAVPQFKCFMLPVLQLFSDSAVHATNECIQTAIDYFQLDENDLKLMVPSGKQTLIANRVYWSLTYLKKSLLLDTIRRGEYKITERGLKLLQTNPKQIDRDLLSQYAEYREFSNQENLVIASQEQNEKEEDITPEESIDRIYKRINEQLCEELLEIIFDKDPYYFERLIMDVLTKIGYGGSNPSNNIVTSKSGDEGIDGIINQDRLGLDKIYIQAKRWKENVGRPELQKFVGAISAQKSNKGIFITTSYFTKEAMEYAKNLSHPIVLINGSELAKLMIEYGVGVQTNYSYDIKKIDNDYFEMI